MSGTLPMACLCHTCTHHWLSHGSPTYLTLGFFFINAERHTLFLSFPALSVWYLRILVPLKPLCEANKPSKILFSNDSP